MFVPLIGARKPGEGPWFRREWSSYVGIAKDAGVAPPKALRVYSNGPSKRAVGTPAAKPTTRLIGVHCSEQRSTLLRPQQVQWAHSPTGISGRLAAGLAKGD